MPENLIEKYTIIFSKRLSVVRNLVIAALGARKRRRGWR